MVGAFPRLEQFDADDLFMVGADYGWSKSMVGAFSCLEHSEIPFPIYGWSIPDGKFGANFWLEQNPVWSILTMLQP